MDITLIKQLKEDIFNKPSNEELKHRNDLRFEVILNELLSRPDCTRNPNWSYSFKSDIDISHKDLFLFTIKFYIVDGHFNCSNNDLVSLGGSPEYVYGSFDCSFNKLKSLKGGPKEVYGNFDCSHNKGKVFTEDEIRKVSNIAGDVLL